MPSKQEDDEMSVSVDSATPPHVENGVVDFALGKINPYLTCSLCNGYYRNPTKIVECLHTFCESCLSYAFFAGFTQCPSCKLDLGPDPYSKVKRDRPLEHLVDRVLFPDRKAEDDEKEKEFYAHHGIKLKAEFQEQEEPVKVSKRRSRATEADAYAIDASEDQIEFTLTPAFQVTNDAKPKQLRKELLRTSGRVKIITLKKYILRMLKIAGDPSTIQMMCDGSQLGNDQNLTFIHRTVWSLSNSDRMDINYCLAKEDSNLLSK